MSCNCDSENTQYTSSEVHNFGPVGCSEAVLLAGIHPLNCQDGELLEGAIDDKKLKKNDPKDNQSVCRREFSSRDEINREILDEMRRKDKERRLDAVFLANAGEIRRIEVDTMNTRAFCVIDEGRETFPSHATISFSDHIRQDKKFWMKANKQAQRGLKAEVIANLIELFQSGSCSLEEAFP